LKISDKNRTYRFPSADEITMKTEKKIYELEISQGPNVGRGGYNVRRHGKDEFDIRKYIQCLLTFV
jgi:hypothetical protein